MQVVRLVERHYLGKAAYALIVDKDAKDSRRSLNDDFVFGENDGTETIRNGILKVAKLPLISTLEPLKHEDFLAVAAGVCNA